MTAQQALQLVSDALEPKAQGQISRSGYVAIQCALEVLAQAINPSDPSAPTEQVSTDATND